MFPERTDIVAHTAPKSLTAFFSDDPHRFLTDLSRLIRHLHTKKAVLHFCKTAFL